MSSINHIAGPEPADTLRKSDSRGAGLSIGSVAIVVIGRNEGDRLGICLQSVMHLGATVVYVDSGSVDGSCERAAALDVPVVRLDPSRPFSAARARNEGFAWVMEHVPFVEFVQFLDGDCELAGQWLSQGMETLNQRPDAGVVCGNVHEQFPNATIYNRLCELEWDIPPGEIRSSGGRFLVRAKIFRAVDGFRDDVIAAEDDELCLRVRRQGWKILQVNSAMAVHDAAMTKFSAWWRRARRSGHAYAQGAALHGRSADRHFVRDVIRIILWAVAIPLAAVLPAFLTHGWSLLVLLAYPLQAARVYSNGRKRGWQAGDSALYAVFALLSKFPALLGLLEYCWKSSRGYALTIIEYKSGSAPE
jgi:GT2 family glycosyltransferase